MFNETSAGRFSVFSVHLFFQKVLADIRQDSLRFRPHQKYVEQQLVFDNIMHTEI